MPAWLSTGAGSVTLKVMARPGASRVGLLRVDPRGLVIGVAAAPERGRVRGGSLHHRGLLVHGIYVLCQPRGYHRAMPQ